MGSKKGGIIKDPTYTYYDDGGSVKPPIKDDIPIKDINLDSELNKLGNIFLKLNNRDRATVMDLLKRSELLRMTRYDDNNPQHRKKNYMNICS